MNNWNRIGKPIVVLSLICVFVTAALAVTNEVTACTNVVSKYHKALLCGALDPATTIDQFNSELEAAGLAKIIEAKQTQLDAWLETQG